MNTPAKDPRLATIHLATEEDAHVIGKLVYSLMVELEHSSFNMSEAFYATKAQELLTARQIYVFIAKDAHGEPVGFISLATSSAIYAEGVFGAVNELYVLPAMRSAGVGKLLLNKAKAFASEMAWTRLEVTAAHERISPRTVHFYLREQFMEVGPRLKFELNA